MSQETDLLRDALSARLAKAAAADVWPALGEMGLFGLTLAESEGGAGADLSTAAAAVAVLGDLCLPAPLIEAHIAARLVSGVAGDAAARVRAALVAGERIGLIGLEPRIDDALTIADGHVSGTARLVIDGDSASLFLLIDRETSTLSMIARDAAAGITAYPTLDGRMAADVTFDSVPAEALGGDATRIAQAGDEAIALIASEAAGLMTSLVRQTADYARQREQFGQAIGSFQVVQHRIVDMHIAARRAGAIARAAVAACNNPLGAERTRTISAAKATINQSGRFVGQNAVQLHGGMGMTEELPVGRYFKRLTMIETQLGSTHDHVRHYAESMATA